MLLSRKALRPQLSLHSQDPPAHYPILIVYETNKIKNVFAFILMIRMITICRLFLGYSQMVWFAAMIPDRTIVDSDIDFDIK